MTVIQCCDLSLGYEGKCVLSHLELSVQEGDYLAIVGENGAGKSTLLRGILGLIRPTGGHIHFHLPPSQVGYLPQQTPIQRDFPASVTEVVLSGLLAAKGCKAALLLDQDVYPPGTIALTGSRVFGSLSMERTVSYTASVIRASGSGLRYLFDKLLRAEGSSYLPIDKIVMQDTGLIGQCQDQQILVGNSDFMSRQGIALPPGIKAKDAVFCAVDRELVGMFVLRYTLHPSILPSLQTMIAHRISPVMATRDFNLTPHRLRLWGRLSVDQITFPDLQRRVVLSGPRQIHGTTLVAVLCREGVAPFSQALVASQRIRRAAAFSQWFVHIGACVGVVITAALSSAGALTAMSPWNLSLFLLLWFVPVLMLSLWTTQY